jgi:hypothetical protein
VTYLDKPIHDLSQASLKAVFSSVPSPSIEEVIITGLLFDQSVLREPRWIVVQEIPKSIDDLADSSGKVGIVLRQLFRKSD